MVVILTATIITTEPLSRGVFEENLPSFRMNILGGLPR